MKSSLTFVIVLLQICGFTSYQQQRKYINIGKLDEKKKKVLVKLFGLWYCDSVNLKCVDKIKKTFLVEKSELYSK